MSQRRQVMEAASEFGGTAVMQYWNDVVNVSLALTERQAALWSGIWQQAVSGATTPDFAREDLRRVWSEYLHGLSTWVTFPVQWWLRWIGDVPTVVFILDLHASASWVQSMAAPVSVTGLSLGCTDLQLVTGAPRPRVDTKGRFRPGDAVLPSEHVLLKHAALGERVDVQIVNLHEPPSMPPDDGPAFALPASPEAPDGGFSHYQYVGVAYAQELHVRRPLAMLTVVFLPRGGAP